MATLAFVLTHPAVEDIGINVMAYGQRSQRYATSQILRHQFCFELRTVTPAPANLLGIVLCHYKHPLIISWVLSLAYFDAAEKMPSPDVYKVMRIRRLCCIWAVHFIHYLPPPLRSKAITEKVLMTY